MDTTQKFATTNMLWSRRTLDNIIMAFLAMGVVLVILPMDNVLSKFNSKYAVQIMLVYLALGIASLFFKRERLVFTNFACCAALCIFLKTHSNESIMFPKRNSDTAIKVVYVNTSDTNEDYESLVKSIIKSDADLVAVQEVTPDWDEFLQASLREHFPYVKSIVRIDFFGQAVFSKYPFVSIDTFHYKDIPNLIGSVKINHDVFHFVCSHTAPAFGTSSFYKDLKQHLTTIIDKVKNTHGALIALGAFNTVEWSAELQDFRSELRLQNSRRSSNPFGNIPYEHIFYSRELECIYFSPLDLQQGTQVGLQGIYQFKNHALGSVPQLLDKSVQ